MHNRLRLFGAVVLAAAVAAAVAVNVRSQQGQQTFQHGFESHDPKATLWLPGSFDAKYREISHELTEETAHSGQKSEVIQLQAEKGTFIYYTYPIGKAPLIDELNVSVWMKANRPGMQLLCRVVLPRERDPNNPEQPLTVLLPGDNYTLAGRWQQLTVRQPVKRLREKLQLLNEQRKEQSKTEQKQPVIDADAYVDRLFLNVYGGPGETKVWTDDLEVGPLLDVPAATPDTTTPGQGLVVSPTVNRRPNEVKLQGTQLVVNGTPLFMRAIRHTGTPLKTLHRAGFNVVGLDETTPPGLIDEAANLGFWIIPTLAPPTVADSRVGQVNAQLTAASRDAFVNKLTPFLRSDAVLAVDLGSNIQNENKPLVELMEKTYHSFDNSHPQAVDLMDGVNNIMPHFPPDSLMLGMHRWPLMTGLELTGYRDWLTQRRQLAQLKMPDRYCWTWIQTHLDDWYTTQVYDRPSANGFDEPVGPLAEQIRLLTYCAVCSGYRGLGFWSDRFLADSHAGRDRLLAMALLNQELQLLEPLLVNTRPAAWIDTANPNVKAAVFRTEGNKSILVIPMWLGGGSQFVVAQGAATELKIVVPRVPDGAQSFEVSPGQVLPLPTARVVGGTEVLLHEFDLTAAIVFTSDIVGNGLLAHFQERQRTMAPEAARWAYEEAIEELAKVEKVEAELEEMGVKLVDGEQLLAKSRSLIDASTKARRDLDYAEAYANARRSLRPLRILMRAQWDRAVRYLDDTPMASIYAVSFFTLPRFWKFAQELKHKKPGANVLTNGDFEMPMAQQPPGWLLDNPQPLDPVLMSARRVDNTAKEGKQSLLLEIKPKPPANPKEALVPLLTLDRSYLAITSPTVTLPPGSWVKISGWVKIPQKISSSVDGALFFDSAAGEPFGVRLLDKTDWKKISLYRQIPASGTINVSMVMTGIGHVYFDDIRIEPLVFAEGPAAETPANTTSKATVPQPH
jgi:hypothetical protein